VALESVSANDRREWVTALARTRETWEACYERRSEGKVEAQLEFIRDGRNVKIG
jgi:hypothetical protein